MVVETDVHLFFMLNGQGRTARMRTALVGFLLRGPGHFPVLSAMVFDVFSG